jgi:serine/threonine-protein kinase
MTAPDLKALGRYRIERVLGKGAMGVVYEGFDPRLSRRVAIKTILKHNLDEALAKDYSARFVREAQAVGKLNHPNIVQVHDFGEEGDIAYLVLEFIKGRELKSYFDKNERFEMKEVVRIMGELCEALDYAHKAGIVHRDVKPGNVMLDEHMRVKLTDFGVARIQESGAAMTQAGTMVGTPAFMSPEQITGKPVDARSDVFSAGVILYQFLTGEMPFTGAGAWTIAKKIMQDDPAAPSTLDGTISPIYDAVVSKALAKQPAHRYQSAREMGVALKRAYEGKLEDFDEDKTVMIRPPEKPAPAQAPKPAAAQTPTTTQGTHDAELEFWRAIKDGNDPEDFELYVKQFPKGIYAELAKRKIEKLRSGVLDEGSQAGPLRTDPMQRALRTDPNQRSRVEPAQQTVRIERRPARAEEDTHPEEAKRSSGAAKYAIAGIAVAVLAAGGWFAFKPGQAPAPDAAKAKPLAPVLTSAAPPATPAPDTSKQEAEKLAADKLAAEKRAAEEAARRAEAEKKLAAEEAARKAALAKDSKERERLLAEKQAAEKAAEAAKAQLAKLADEKAKAEKAAVAAAAAAAAAAARAQADREAAERLAQQRGAAQAKLAQEQAAKAAALAEAEKRAAAARAAEEKDKADRAEAEARMLAVKATADQKAAAEKAAADRAEAEKMRLARLEEQKANDARRPGRLFRDCEGCPEMVIVPAGSFTMGSPDAEASRHGNEGPQRRVAFAQPFAVGKFEVTFDEWEMCVREKGCAHNPGYTAWGRGKRPVIDISWTDAKQYAAWLGRKSGKPYRLLSEAEWEYVARAGTTTPFSFGGSISPQQANYDAAVSYAGSPTGAKQGKTVPVGSYAANRFGLHDVHGNVWEWVEDCWNTSHAGAPADGSARASGNCAQRVVKGGSWDSEPQTLRSALRYYQLSTIRQNTLGFRVARALD